MNKILLATAAIVLLAASAPSYAQQATTKDQFVGRGGWLRLKPPVAIRSAILSGSSRPVR